MLFLLAAGKVELKGKYEDSSNAFDIIFPDNNEYELFVLWLWFIFDTEGAN